MKQKIVLHDKIHDKTIVTEVEVRNLDHFEAQLKNKAHIFKPKKGKGSFKRDKRKVVDEELEKN